MLSFRDSLSDTEPHIFIVLFPSPHFGFNNFVRYDSIRYNVNRVVTCRVVTCHPPFTKIIMLIYQFHQLARNVKSSLTAGSCTSDIVETLWIVYQF